MPLGAAKSLDEVSPESWRRGMGADACCWYGMAGADGGKTAKATAGGVQHADDGTAFEEQKQVLMAAKRMCRYRFVHVRRDFSWIVR